MGHLLTCVCVRENINKINNIKERNTSLSVYFRHKYCM